MELLVVGATGRTGRHIVDVAVEQGHTVRAFARSAAEQPGWANEERVIAVAGDALDPAAVSDAVQGVDAIAVALSMVRTSNSPWARITTPLDLHPRAATVLTEAAWAHGVRRYVMISAHGAGDSASRAGWLFLGLVRSSNIGVAYRGLAEAEAVVARTELDWTVVRPTRLTDGAPTGSWEADPELVTTSLDHVDREDLARFVVRTATTTTRIQERVSLTGRSRG